MVGQPHLSESSGGPHKAKEENWGEDHGKLSHRLVLLDRLSPDLEGVLLALFAFWTR